MVSFRPQAEYEALQAAQVRLQTDEFKFKYKKRAGIEGTISQGVRAFGLRRSRFVGLAKTHLQHLATAASINLTRAIQCGWPVKINHQCTDPLSPVSSSNLT